MFAILFRLLVSLVLIYTVAAQGITSCTPGVQYPAEDGCNTCLCMDGLPERSYCTHRDECMAQVYIDLKNHRMWTPGQDPDAINPQ